MAGVVPWSYSTLTAFETCPRRYYLTKIAKTVKEPQSEAMFSGNEVHKAIELDLKGTKPLPEKYISYAPMVNSVRQYSGKKLVEHSFGLDVNLRPVGFFDKTVWVRGKIDFALVGTKSAALVDWKTGKVKEDLDQMRLFAGAGFALFPYIEKIRTSFVWLPASKTTREDFTRKDIPIIWEDFAHRVRRMEQAEKTGEFPPNPSGLCRNWCPVGADKCEFCGG